ncbi:DUF4381 domain-containing protein [Shimia sp.]|uniref:DUF4381 domain-containing protein n=1 Tax=Shimia sp. TaxID=1954381 RepID=UPI00329A221E
MSDTSPPENLVDLINKLQEVPDPAPVSMLPQTQGWIVLAAFVAVAALFGARKILHRHRANAYRRTALVELQHAGDDAARISAILKRTALVAYPRQDVAPLTGQGWIAFLERTGTGGGFESGPGAALATAAFIPGDTQAPGLNALACQWVRQHDSRGSA